MDLKDKFLNFQPEFDEKAWENFLLLKEKKKRKRKVLLWFRYGGISFVGIAMVVLSVMYLDNNDTLVNSIDNKKQVSNKVEKKIVPSTNDLSNVDKEISSNEYLENTTMPLVIDDKRNAESVSNKLTISKKTTPLGFEKQQIQNKELAASRVNKLAVITTEKFGNTSTLTQKKKSLEENKQLVSTINKSTVVEPINLSFEKANSVEIANMAILATKSLTFLHREEPIFVAPPIIKKHIPSKNFFKIGVGYADGFINGFTLEEDEPVDKRGIAVQAAYYRNLSKLLGIGLSGGYVSAIDRANPQLAVKDKEVIQFVHLNLYFFLVNEKRHRLYGKVGAGPTKTDRVLGAFYWDQPNNILERRLQINTLRSLGVLVEGGYEFEVAPRLWLGTNYSIISHNDGGWFAGLSIGHKF